MVKVFVEYLGDLHCRVRHEPSGAVMETDAPVDNQGKGESFSPTDLVAAALGSCIATVVGIYAKRQGWKLEGMRVEVEKQMATAPTRRIGRLLVNVWMPIILSDKDQQIVDKVAHTCPVHQSLHPDVEAPIVFHWPS